MLSDHRFDDQFYTKRGHWVLGAIERADFDFSRRPAPLVTEGLGMWLLDDWRKRWFPKDE